MKSKRTEIFNRINELLNKSKYNPTDQKLINQMISKNTKHKIYQQLKRIQSIKVKHHKRKKSTTSIIKHCFLSKLICSKLKGHYTITYNRKDKRHLANSRNDFSIFRILADLKLVKLVDAKPASLITKIVFSNVNMKATFALTPIGNQYVNQLLASINKKRTKVQYYILTGFFYLFAGLFVITLLSFMYFYISENSELIAIELFIITIPNEIVAIFLEYASKRFVYKKIMKYSNKLISRKYFLNILKKRHIREPSINFSYDSRLPKIDKIMFN